MKRKEGWYWYRKAGPEIHPWEMVWVFSTHSVIRFGSSAAPGTCFDVERIENMHGDWHGPIALPGEEQASQWNSVEDSSPGDGLRVLLWTPAWVTPMMGQMLSHSYRSISSQVSFNNQPTHWMPLPVPPVFVKPLSIAEESQLREAVLRWFATSSVMGLSAKAMATHLCGLPCDGSYPCDADDFRRCVMFLEAVPLARRLLRKMAEVNRTWAKLVHNWSEIEAALEVEGAPRTADGESQATRLISDIIRRART